MTNEEKQDHAANQRAFNMRYLFEISDLNTFQYETEKLFITEKLKKNKYNVRNTAKELGIQRSHMYNKIKMYKIDISGDRSNFKNNVQILFPIPENLLPGEWYKAYEL